MYGRTVRMVGPLLLATLSILAQAISDPNAQVSLAEKYRIGLGVEQNYAEALRLYKLAAAQGVARAQFDLAEMCRFGEAPPPTIRTLCIGTNWRLNKVCPRHSSPWR